MEFYKLWRGWGGTIGVAKFSLGEMVGIQFASLLLYVIALAFAVTILPMILFSIYLFSMITRDSDEQSSVYRLWLNILTVISTIYFLLDYHYGWFSFKILGSSMFAETYDWLATTNLSIGLISILLFFVGHEVYRVSPNRLIRIVTILFFVFMGFKFTDSISESIVPSVITQYNDEGLTNKRLEMKKSYDENHHSDEYYENQILEMEEADKKKDQEMKDFDKNYAKEYLNN